MTQRFRSIALLGLVGGCFGEGPIPGLPTEATILYTVAVPASNSECSASNYIGSVAVGSYTDAYAVALPYTPNNNNCGNGGSLPPTQPVSVELFKKDRTEEQILGGAGMTDGSQPPRVAAAGVNGVWAYRATSTTSDGITVAPALGSIPPSTMGGGGAIPAGIVGDATTVFVAGWSPPTGGKSEVNNPNYPCCGPASTGGGNPGTLSKMPSGGGGPITALPVFPRYACESMSDCLVANTTSLFFMEYADPAHLAKITSFPKTSTAPGDAVMIGFVDSAGTSKIVPVGLAADDSHVAWSVSVGYELQRSEDPLPPPLCIITAYDLATQTTTVLLSTTEFSCMHVSVDADFAYFAIVSIKNQHMRGDGVGRVSFANQAFESLALGIQGDSAGPRRVYVVDDSVYLVDPFVVAAIKPTALDGKQDFKK